MDKKLFGHDLIRALGFTSYGLAKKADVTYSSMQMYLTGKAEPKLRNARRICDVLNLPLDIVEFPCERPQVKETEVCTQ